MLSLQKQEAEEVGGGEQVQVADRENRFEYKIWIGEVKEQAVSAGHFANGIPQVEEKFYSDKNEHKPVSQGLSSEKEHGGEEKKGKDKQHHQYTPYGSKQVTRIVVEAQIVRDLGDKISKDQ